MFLNAVVIGSALLIWFLIKANKRQKLSVILAWLIPGAGHFYLGEKQRGLFLGGLVVLTFVVGMVIADFRNISPLERHPIWGIAHLFGGLMSVIATAATSHLKLIEINSLYHVGCLYSGVGALMNILVAIDAYDLASKEPEAVVVESQEAQA